MTDDYYQLKLRSGLITLEDQPRQHRRKGRPLTQGPCKRGHPARRRYRSPSGRTSYCMDCKNEARSTP